jgi:hypothetical protein
MAPAFARFPAFQSKSRPSHPNRVVIDSENGICLSMRFPSLFAAIGILLVGLGIGCSSEEEDKPEVVPVEIKVLSAGNPAKGAIVTLVPEDKSARRPTGIVDAEGMLSLMTLEPGDGAPPGNYKVTVVWPVGAERLSRQQLQDAAYGGETPPDRLKGKLSDSETTPLSLTIEPGQHALPPIELPAQ